MAWITAGTRRFRNASILVKGLAGFGAVVACSLLLGILSLDRMSTINSAPRYIVDNTLPSLKVTQAAINAASDLRIDQGLYVDAATTAARHQLAVQISAARAQTVSQIDEYARTLLTDATDRRHTLLVREIFTRYLQQTAGVLPLASAGSRTQASAILDSASGTFSRLVSAARTWSDYNYTIADRVDAGAHSTYDSSRVFVILLLLVVTLVSAVIAVLQSRSIKRAADEMLRAADGIAEGDVHQEIQIFSEDELGRTGAAFIRMIDYLTGLATVAERVAAGDLTVEPQPRSNRDLLGNAFAKLVADLRDVVGKVSGSADQVAAASQEMAATSEQSGRATSEIAVAVGDIAHGTERQVQAVFAARSAADEVGRSVVDAAQSSQRTAESAQQARDLASRGVEAAEQASDAMRAVSDSSHEVSTTIRALSQKSAQIGQIVETITGIAEQTNLLALNAAIESARAGEQGRGFAVVAEEVRKLAEGSQRAAEEIGALIGSIQTETERAVDVVDDCAKRTEDGVAVVERTREAFEQIGGSVDRMSEQIEQIAATSQQIAASAESMNSNIASVSSLAEQSSASTEQVSASAQETSAAAQQISASAQNLAASAEVLNHMIRQFKLPV